MVIVTETDLQIKVSPAAIAEILSDAAKAGLSRNGHGSEFPISKTPRATGRSMESNSALETLSVPIIFKRRGVETKLIVQGPRDRTDNGQIDSALMKAIARAHAWFEDLATGRVKNCSDVAARERITVSSVSRLLPLAFLAPQVVEAIMAGEQSLEISAQALIRREDIPSGWGDQCAAFVR